MKPLDFFFESCLLPGDAVVFAKTFEVLLRTLGREQCWCMKKQTHAAFAGFVTSHNRKLLYKNQDARPLALALTDRYYNDERPIMVRRSCCSSIHCINPMHYYYGTRKDVALEAEAKNPKPNENRNTITPSIIEDLRQERDAGQSILKLSRKYKLPYHVARRICSEDAYNSNNGNFSDKYLNRLWEKTIENCEKICQDNPSASRAFDLAFHVTEKLECPWHRQGFPGHKGNFGLMGECLDCMEEIKKGRCSVDVTQFDIKWYWQVKRFWEQVEIKGEDECWPWKGATRRNNTESTAYFPSPFHSGKTQSASRVAFWLSRGYTGKYRVFNKLKCEPFCCNPTHLLMRELKELPEPTTISEIRLSHDNIFSSYRKNLPEKQPGIAD